MAQHLVTVVALSVDTDIDTGPYCEAVNLPDLTTTRVDITDEDVVALLVEIEGTYGIALPNVTLAPGDTLVVVGSVSRIPPWQVGAMFTVDVDGWCHLVNAGAIAAAIAAIP